MSVPPKPWMHYCMKCLRSFCCRMIQAPVERVEGTTCVAAPSFFPSSDKTLHFAYQGRELRRIFENCFELMPVNTTKLLRYASRRGKTEEMTEMIEPFIHKKTTV